jgi:hypothetical protein
MPLTKLYTVLLTFCCICSYTRVFAGDRDFSYTYQSHVLAKHDRELELWFTYVDERASTYYKSLNHRAEFEIGLGHRLQTAFYLNLGYAAFESQTLSGIDPYNYTPIYSTGISGAMQMSFSNEWKYQLSDPVANAVGSAIYAEVSVGPQFFEWEAKLILDKRIGDLVTALNVVGELEKEAELETIINFEGVPTTEVEWETEKVFELVYGLSYQFSHQFSAGIELQSETEIGEDELETVLYGGPAISYKSENWWLAFTAFPQLSNFENESEDLPFESRLLFSYHF